MKRVYIVPDMHCPTCALRLESIEDTLSGIRSIAASYHKRRLEVEYEEAQLSEAQIVAAVAELGYTLVKPVV